MSVQHQHGSTCTDHCSVGACHPKCSLEVVDGLLSLPEAVTGEEVDLLLDFRSLLRARRDAETTLRVFCDLRRRMEPRHYLAFYRLRRWLENQVAVKVLSTENHEIGNLALHLDFYCLEAIRRQCVCAAMKLGMMNAVACLQFSFCSIASGLSGLPIKYCSFMRERKTNF